VIDRSEDESVAGEARLRAYLTEHGVAAQLVSSGVPMPTVPLAAAATGVHESQIIKSVLFQSASGEVILAIARGTARIDRVKLATVSGHMKLKLASPEIVLASTGFPAGGVAPIGHATPLVVVMDRHVLTEAFVYGGAGSETTLVEITPAQILALTGGQVADILADLPPSEP
jgi:prolyl-tRNA editing enzyme YbaK/EbsC (Cys-tRNA(Pro) deacylase)